MQPLILETDDRLRLIQFLRSVNDQPRIFGSILSYIYFFPQELLLLLVYFCFYFGFCMFLLLACTDIRCRPILYRCRYPQFRSSTVECGWNSSPFHAVPKLYTYFNEPCTIQLSASTYFPTLFYFSSYKFFYPPASFFLVRQAFFSLLSPNWQAGMQNSR